ncbi:solute carrier family 35 member E2A isoform X1 [Octopus sinensis]|uniref:Solute carrier family 35 member E2A isoform X1 n=2 Tax=Octopus sinensis TaxID=2607531 RepID=A0A6P7SZ95_9MOLL|nr:solute carrier family 35 member E2A isoform X1 [Octopus sinensis]XP_036363861.1 solute carrier family 35 member E2A isoform X1 [Octopus sinensis]XP_036363862.1 solute carrier family 35 member E2A isoform X1 [Octopus sinensis]
MNILSQRLGKNEEYSFWRLNMPVGDHGHSSNSILDSFVTPKLFHSLKFPSVRMTRSNSTLSREESCEKVGLLNLRAFIFLLLWYFFSFCTLFLNKYILSTLSGDPTLLGAMQMVMTTVLGFVQIYLPCGMYVPIQREGKPPNFWRNMIVVGIMRFITVVLGLVALKFVAVSFTETIKSSAPLFTVFISWALIGERTGLYTFLSLIPIMAGLALCSAYELSFSIKGFVAALATNITECLQNVYSKMLISGEKYRYTPAELQFYTSIASVVVQIPACFLMMDITHAKDTLDYTMFFALITNGIFFHFQSITAYVLMGYISPVTHSVANTVKRAFLIWLSVIVFGNPVTLLSALGTVTVTVGVLCYTKAKDYDKSIVLKAHYAVKSPDTLDKII